MEASQTIFFILVNTLDHYFLIAVLFVYVFSYLHTFPMVYFIFFLFVKSSYMFYCYYFPYTFCGCVTLCFYFPPNLLLFFFRFSRLLLRTFVVRTHPNFFIGWHLPFLLRLQETSPPALEKCVAIKFNSNFIE